MTPTSAASRSPRPPTTRRSWPSRAARSRTAASSSRGCSTASRTSRAASAGARRRRSASSCAAAGRSPTPPSARSRRPATTPLRLLEAPRGATANPQPYPKRPYAGAFETLRVQGATARGGIAIQHHAPFKADLHRDRVAGDAGPSGKQIEVLFPSWGAGARVTAVNASGGAQAGHARDGARATSTGSTSRASAAGYVVDGAQGGTGATALTRRPSAQSSAPKPGPTLTHAGEGDDGRRRGSRRRRTPRRRGRWRRGWR